MKKVLIFPFAALLILSCGLNALATVATTHQVKGTVYWDKDGDGIFDQNESGVAGVCVSNGREVVLTDKHGKYSLPAYEEMTVFLTKPADYECPLNENNIPQFAYIHQPNGSPASITQYQGLPSTGPLPAAINFPLFKSSNNPRFKAVILGDTQVYNNREIGYLRDTVVKELSDSKAAFILALGDNVGDDLSLYPRYLSVLKGIKLPIYLVPGNHDMNYDSPDDAHSLDTFKREFGPTYYSFNYGQIHFVVLDSIYYPSPIFSTKTHQTYHWEITGQQMEWLRNDLAYVPADHLIVLNMHIPIVSLTDSPSQPCQIQNRTELYSLLMDAKCWLWPDIRTPPNNFCPALAKKAGVRPLPFIK